MKSHHGLVKRHLDLIQVDCRGELCLRRSISVYEFVLHLNATWGFFRHVNAEEANALEKVHFMGFDVTGGKIEYDILRPMGPHTTHRQVGA